MGLLRLQCFAALRTERGARTQRVAAIGAGVCHDFGHGRLVLLGLLPTEDSRLIDGLVERCRLDVRVIDLCRSCEGSIALFAVCVGVGIVPTAVVATHRYFIVEPWAPQGSGIYTKKAWNLVLRSSYTLGPLQSLDL